MRFLFLFLMTLGGRAWADNTDTFTYTATPSATPTPTAQASQTATLTFSASPSPTSSSTITPSVTKTVTGTPTATLTWSVTKTSTATLTATPTPTSTNTKSATPTFSSTITKTATPTGTGTFTRTITATPTVTSTFTVSPTFTATLTYTLTWTPTPAPTGTFVDVNVKAIGGHDLTAQPTWGDTVPGLGPLPPAFPVVGITYCYDQASSSYYPCDSTNPLAVMLTTATPTRTWTPGGNTVTPTKTHTPAHVVIDTPTFTPTWTAGGNTATLTPTLTPATGVNATVTGTVTPPTVALFALPTTVADTAVIAALNYQISAIPTPVTAQVAPAATGVPTVVATGANVPIARDVRGAGYTMLVDPFLNGGGARIVLPNADGTGTAANGGYSLQTVGLQSVYNGNAGFDRMRLMTTYNCLTITASGSTAIIGANTNGGNSPLISGNKWRLMGYKISLTGDVTDASGDVYIKFIDNSTNMGIAETFDTPTSALTNSFGIIGPWISLGNGIASASANNALNVNLSSALATGVCTVCVGFVQGTTP